MFEDEDCAIVDADEFLASPVRMNPESYKKVRLMPQSEITTIKRKMIQNLPPSVVLNTGTKVKLQKVVKPHASFSKKMIGSAAGSRDGSLAKSYASGVVSNPTMPKIPVSYIQKGST